jgi:hypothetical protein
MAYIGKNLAGVLKENKTVTTMIGDGSDTTLTLSDSPGSVNNVLLFLDGVRQTPVTNYNVSGTALTFTTAPAAGVNVVAVVGNHSGVDTRNLSVTSQKIVDGMVTDAKIATGISTSKLTGSVLPALDGSALTGIAAGETPIFKSASDPTITSNKTLGQLWSNSTSGEMYVCTDATTNANVWTNVGDGSGSVPAYMSATNTNGTETTDGDYKVVTFNTSGSFTPSIGLDATLGNKVDYLVIAGGGGGGTKYGGGGGAGGYLTATNFTVTSSELTVTVGGGGDAGSSSNGSNGGNSIFSSITSIGGGGGGRREATNDTTVGSVGGSGGGAGDNYNGTTVNGGAGTAGQGFAGGGGVYVPYLGGGGGGASQAGYDPNHGSLPGDGGAGLSSSITGLAVTRAGGGGGGNATSGGYLGGDGGAGGGGFGSDGDAQATEGSVNTGSGGGGGGDQGNTVAAAGGSGVVIVRYKFQ